MTIASLGLAVDSAPAVRAAVDLDMLAASSAVAEQAVNKLGTAAPAALTKVANSGGAVSDKLRQVANDAESFAARINRALNVASNAPVIGSSWTTPFAGDAMRGADIEAYGRSLDTLRAKYNPLFAAISQYKVAQAEIRQAHAFGAISVNEMTFALERERTAALASISALKGRSDVVPPQNNNPMRSNSFNTANIAAQFQDIGVTTAMGMAPLQIALQQGTQLSAVFEQLKSSGQGVGSSLAAAFRSIISPMSLLTIGAIAATAAVVQYFTSAGDGVKTVDDILKRHKENIDRLGPAYAEVLEAQKKYVAESPALVSDRLADDARDALKKRVEEAKAASDTISKALATQESFGLNTGSFGVSATIFDKARGAIAEFNKTIQAGQPNVQAFQEEISRLAASGDLTQEAAAKLRKYTDEARNTELALADVTGKVDLVANAFTKAQDAIDQINPLGASGRLSDIETRLEKLFKQMQAGEANASDLAREVSNLSKLNPDLSGPIARIAQLGQEALLAMARVQALQNVGGNTTTPTGDRLRGPGRSQNEYDNALEFFLRTDKELQEKLKSSNKSIDRENRVKPDRDANAYRDLVKNANDRIEQMKLEQELIGKTGVAQDTLRFKMDLVQKATDKGRTISKEHRVELEKLAAQYGKVAEQTAKATLQADLLFERQQMFRSPLDQTIASTLKGAGLEVDFNSYEAGLIRTNEQLKEARELAGDFASTFIQGIESGKSVFESLGDAALSVLDKITDKLLNDVLNALFEVNGAGSGSGGGIFGSILGALGLGGGGGMSSSYFPPAPSMGGGGLYENGDAFPNGVSGFRNTIVDTPTVFKFAKGTGIMGEAGPEAIMPLKRDSAGRLGVSAQAGSAANSNRPQEVTLRILNEEGPMFRTTIRAESEEVSVKVVQQNNENQKNYKQNGGE